MIMRFMIIVVPKYYLTHSRPIFFASRNQENIGCYWVRAPSKISLSVRFRLNSFLKNCLTLKCNMVQRLKMKWDGVSHFREWRLIAIYEIIFGYRISSNKCWVSNKGSPLLLGIRHWGLMDHIGKDHFRLLRFHWICRSLGGGKVDRFLYD